MKLEVIERTVYSLTGEIANDMRRALAADDLERLDELISFIRDTGDLASTCDVLECQEVKR
jgi:hypothetical protein